MSQNPEVKKGSLIDILKYILGIPEASYLEPFLLCYPKWLTTEKLFTGLETLASPMSCGLYPQLAPFLNFWINIHLRASLSDNLNSAGKEAQERIATKILTITNNLFKAGFEEEANRLKLTMIRINKDLSKKTIPAKPIPEPKHAEIPKGPLKLSTLLSRKVAEQLTLLESRMFRAITANELYSRGWTKETKEKDAPHITAMINHSTKVSHWVASLILNQKEENNRIRAIQRVVTIAQSCLELKNYNAVMEIVGGLSMWPVARIIKGMKIPKRFVVKMKAFHSLFDGNRNWKSYRETLAKDRESGVPHLPYLGLFLTDIVFLEEGNADFYERDVINFEKMVLLGNQLLSFQNYQKFTYSNLVKEKESNILKYLTNLPFFSEEKLEKLSNDIKTIPEDFKTKPSMKQVEIDWDSAEMSTGEDDSWSEEAVSENDFEELSTTSTSDDLYREYFNEEYDAQHPRLK